MTIKMNKWTKKLDDIHISGEDGMTLCGRPRLGSNYIEVYKDIDKIIGKDRKECLECLKKLED